MIAPMVAWSVTGVSSLALQIQLGELTAGLARLLGLAFAAAAVATVGAAVHRLYVHEPLSNGLAAVLGVGTVAIYLNTVGLFGQVLDPVAVADPFAVSTVVSNVAALLGGAFASPVGRRVGDRVARTSLAAAGETVDPGAVGRLRGRMTGTTAVELPPATEIADLAGYDPVSDATRDRLGGRTVALPRGTGSLGDRLATHLRETYDVGRVDADVEDGTVTYLAVGTRPAGVAPTLSPGTVAVPVRADPPNGAGPGDLVQVWTVPETTGEEADDATPAGDGEAPTAGSDGAPATASGSASVPGTTPRRVATAELRATTGDVVTLAIDETAVTALSAAESYRLVTLPARRGPDREFASLLSAADERMDAVTVAPGSSLVGATIDDVAGTVVAVRTADGDVEAVPGRRRTVSAGETLYVVALPEVIRRLTDRATAPGDPAGDA